MKINISFPAILGIVFIILKLINKIDWSWWWVLSPFWIPLALFIIIFILILILKIGAEVINSCRRR
jgi:hypothetical protein